MFECIDHIGVAVDDLEAAVELWSEKLEMPVEHRETVSEQGVEAVLLGVGDSHIELLAPLGEDTPVGKFLAKRGPGVHHAAFRCDDISRALALCEERGLRMIDTRPRRGIRGSLVAFVHPASTGGMLMELVQPAGEALHGA
jgi:methylmalonyl-CoA/ethylmalonyl-CoA epimerase